jgi:hypothetical protein
MDASAMDAVMKKTGVSEEVLLAGDGLVGIVSLPAGDPDPDRPALLILNSGVIHRVGACRLSVKLARRMASAGHVSCRFDHSGIGDSPPSRSGLEVDAGQVSEIVDVMNAVERRTGVSRFLLYGLCSGARAGFHAALDDSRVVGIVQVDGFAYRTPRHYLLKGIRRLRHFRTVPRVLGRWLGLRKPPVREEAGADMWVQEWPDYPPRGEVAAGYARLVERGVRIHAIYTGSWKDEYNYRRQFFEMYQGVEFRGMLTLCYLPHAQHILPHPEDQERVVEGVAGWVVTEFNPAPETET